MQIQIPPSTHQSQEELDPEAVKKIQNQQECISFCNTFHNIVLMAVSVPVTLGIFIFSSTGSSLVMGMMAYPAMLLLSMWYENYLLSKCNLKHFLSNLVFDIVNKGLYIVELYYVAQIYQNLSPTLIYPAIAIVLQVIFYLIYMLVIKRFYDFVIVLSSVLTISRV